MKLSVKRFIKAIQSKTTIICIAAFLVAPAASLAQSDNEPEETSTGSGSGPWENSAGSSVGTRSGAFSEGTVLPANPAIDPATGTAARPNAGPTVDATGGPGGNPDVPFDSNMNLVFLAAGVAFAFMVYRRRLKLKAVPAEKG